MSQARSSSRIQPRNPNQEYLRKEAKRLARDGGLQLAKASSACPRIRLQELERVDARCKVAPASSSSGRCGEPAVGIGLSASAALDKLLSRPIERLFLSYRTYRGLDHESIKHVDELKCSFQSKAAHVHSAFVKRCTRAEAAL